MPRSRSNVLKAREHSVIPLRLQGYTHQQIADMLHITPNQVHESIMRIYRHYDVHSTEELYGKMLELQSRERAS